MPLDVMNVLNAGAGRSIAPVDDASSASKTENTTNKSAEAANPGAGNAAPPVERETANAIEPTPATAPAVKVDMDTARNTDEIETLAPTGAQSPAVKVDFGTFATTSPDELQYPISGPDEFARLSAEMQREAIEASQIREQIAERVDVGQVGLDMDDLRGSDEARAAEVEPSADAGVTQGASEPGDAQSVSGVSEQPAEASEARLTEA